MAGWLVLWIRHVTFVLLLLRLLGLAWLDSARLCSARLGVCVAWHMGLFRLFRPVRSWMYICTYVRSILKRVLGSSFFFSLSSFSFLFLHIFFFSLLPFRIRIRTIGNEKIRIWDGFFFLHPLFSFLFSPSLSLNQYSGYYRGKNRKKTIKANRQKLNKQNERKKRRK